MRKLPKIRNYIVSFNLVCSGKNPNTQDIQDALGQFFENDVLQGRITDFDVSINHSKEYELERVVRKPAQRERRH